MHTLVPLTAAHLVHWPDAWPGERTVLLARIRWHLHTPDALALVALAHGHVQGFATAVALGPHAWVTALRWTLDAPPAAHDPLLAALRAQLAHCALHVIAPPVHVSALEALGFARVDAVLHLSGGTVHAATEAQVVPLAPEHRLGAFHLQAHAWGEASAQLLLDHAHLARAWVAQGHVRGLYLPTLGAGLITAAAPHIGLELQRWHLAHHPGLLLPTANTAAVSALRAEGHVPFAEGVWMRTGTPTPLRLPWMFALPWGCAWGGE